MQGAEYLHQKVGMVGVVVGDSKFCCQSKIVCFSGGPLFPSLLISYYTMKRVIHFDEDQDKGHQDDFEFKVHDKTKQQKKKKKNGQQQQKDQKFHAANATTVPLDRATMKQMRKEMLDFRQQLPIYSGKWATLVPTVY
jgi:hypothetical protein